jgi:hypothetical protein
VQAHIAKRCEAGAAGVPEPEDEGIAMTRRVILGFAEAVEGRG